jgi:hypothetical protein
LVEQRCDGLVRSGIAIFARLPAENEVGGHTVAAGLERRLRRLFADRLTSPDSEQRFAATLRLRLDALDPAVRGEAIASDDAVANHVSWPRWIDAHRAILRDLEPPLGLPGNVKTLSIQLTDA